MTPTNHIKPLPWTERMLADCDGAGHESEFDGSRVFKVVAPESQEIGTLCEICAETLGYDVSKFHGC